MIERAKAVLRAPETWVAAGIAGCAAVIAWTALLGLDQSLWSDEVVAINRYIEPGPSGFLGAYGPGNHLLFGALGWVTTEAFGTSEAVYRLWSAVPAIVAPILLALWLWKRRELPYVALGFIFLYAISELQIETVKQARGYGLAMLCTTIMLIAAAEALRRDGSGRIAGFVAAGVAGMATLPPVVLVFATQAGVLAARPSLRRRALVAVGVAATVTLLIYLAPALGGISTSRLLEGEGRGLGSSVSGPLADLVAPVLAELVPGFDSALYRWAGAILIAIGVAGLVRRGAKELAWLTALPLFATYTAFALSGSAGAERFFTFLLPHALFLTAAGFVTVGVAAVALASRWGDRAATAARAALAVVALALALPAIPEALEEGEFIALPREDFREAARLAVVSGAETVHTNGPPSAVLRYYLPDDIELQGGDPDEVGRALCEALRPIVYVEQTVGNPPADTACLEARGAVQVRLPSRRELRAIDVWLAGPTTEPVVAGPETSG